MHAHIKIMHTFCIVLICLKSLPSLIAPLMLCSYVTYQAWVGDYDTLPQFISIAKYKETSSAYEYN